MNTTTTDRLPPHSIEAESGVLGCILLDPANSMDAVLEIVGDKAEMFYDGRHQLIWSACFKLHSERRPIDFLTLLGALKEAGTADQ